MHGESEFHCLEFVFMLFWSYFLSFRNSCFISFCFIYLCLSLCLCLCVCLSVCVCVSLPVSQVSVYSSHKNTLLLLLLFTCYRLQFSGRIPAGRARHSATHLTINGSSVIAIFAGYGCSPTGGECDTRSIKHKYQHFFHSIL